MDAAWTSVDLDKEWPPAVSPHSQHELKMNNRYWNSLPTSEKWHVKTNGRDGASPESQVLDSGDSGCSPAPESLQSRGR